MTHVDGMRAHAATPTTTTARGDVPLEPARELPTAQPFKAGIGTWAKVGGGVVAGGMVGLVAGGIVGTAAAAGNSALGGVVLGAFLLGGLVGGGKLAYDHSRNGHDTREHARIQAEHGTSTLQYARQMMSTFDHDDNGQIDLENSTGLASMDERVATEERSRSRSHPKYDFFRDEWRSETERWTETRGTSAAPVWAAADVAPKDRVVTDVELARLMSKFDADRDGALTTAEQDAFSEAHPVIIDRWQR
jgi:hypothetical protein